MAKTTFIVLMVIETLLALPSMGLLFSDVGAMIYPISLGIFAAMLFPFYLQMKKTDDEARKRKLRLWMVLVMLIPTVAALAAIATVVIALMMYFS